MQASLLRKHKKALIQPLRVNLGVLPGEHGRPRSTTTVHRCHRPGVSPGSVRVVLTGLRLQGRESLQPACHKASPRQVLMSQSPSYQGNPRLCEAISPAIIT